MTTRLRLLAMLLTFMVLFTLSWLVFVRTNRPPEPPPKAKTAAELLVGAWKMTQREPEFPVKSMTASMEFTADGKVTLRLAESQHLRATVVTGTYQLSGDTIRFDYAEGPDNSAHTWNGKIESVTDDTLVLVGTGNKPLRSVFERERGD